MNRNLPNRAQSPPQTTPAPTSAATTSAAKKNKPDAHTPESSPSIELAHNAHQIPHLGHNGLLALQPQIRQDSPQLPRSAAAHRTQNHDDRREGAQSSAEDCTRDFGFEIQYVQERRYRCQSQEEGMLVDVLKVMLLTTILFSRGRQGDEPGLGEDEDPRDPN